VSSDDNIHRIRKPGPAYQHYAQDFLVSVAPLTAEAVGAYIRLLDYQWVNEGLQDDDKVLLALAGCGRKALAAVRDKFPKDSDGMLRNPRLEEVRAEQEAYRDRQAAKAKSRWGECHGNATALPAHMPERCPSPSSQPSDKDLLSVPGGTNPRKGPRKAPIRARNEIIDALASVDGSDPAQVTGSAWGSIAKALAEIKVVSPDVTPAEIERRAARYRQLHRDWTISAPALAKHWASLATPQAAAQTEQTEISEPVDWVRILGPDDEDVRMFGRNQWTTILPFYKQRIAAKVSRARQANPEGKA